MRLAILLLPLLAAPTVADTIYLVDGRSIDNVTIQQETFKEVTYRLNNKNEKVPAETVLSVTYTAMPPLVDRAMAAVGEGQLIEAITDLETYVGGLDASSRKERHEWAPAYASFRLVSLNALVGEPAKAASAADRLIQKYPDSRYVPAAFLAKAAAQAQQGQKAASEKTLDDLVALVSSQALSARWKLEAQLAKVLLNPELKGATKREALIKISGEASREFPTVRNKADAAEGEVLLGLKQVEDAEKIFRRVVNDPQADSATLAMAYTGLGDVLYQKATAASGEPAKKLFKEALLAYMRVVVNHPDQVAHVPKAMFFAGRSFDQIGGEGARDNSAKLYTAILRDYPGTNWASEARGFRK